MRIGDVMTSKVETIGPNQSAEDAWQAMRALRTHHLIVAEGKKLLGVISDRDVGRRAADRKNRTVSELMTPEPITTTPHATVRQVANLLRGHVIGCLPVVDRDRLVGIVTITDLLDLLGRGAERPVEMAKRWTLKHRGPRHQKAQRPR
jgi:CBS domain-containing protein